MTRPQKRHPIHTTGGAGLACRFGRRWRGEKAKRVAQEAMLLSTASGVEGYLKAAVNK